MIVMTKINNRVIKKKKAQSLKDKIRKLPFNHMPKRMKLLKKELLRKNKRMMKKMKMDREEMMTFRLLNILLKRLTKRPRKS